MITVKELKNKCQKYWNAQHIQRALLSSEDVFPLTLLKIRFTARELSEHFGMIRDELQVLRAQSKEVKGFGYTLIYQVIQHRQLGRQTIPESIVFETCSDFLKCAGLNESYRCFSDSLDLVLREIPSLSSWLKENTAKLLEYHGAWPKLLAVVLFLQQHPKPDCYLRELPISGIDTKFIEQHKAILRELLDELLPDDAIDWEVQGLQHHGFERRYGFKYSEPLIRFRVLDNSVLERGLRDISVPLSEFRKLNLACTDVIITENKINGLSFPQVDSAIIIFGLGYGIQSLSGISWLKDKNIYYWGDIDTHGFSILSQCRSYYPQVKSLFMDSITLKQFHHMAVEESDDKRCIAELAYLNEKEQALYQSLYKHEYGNNLRIEQERIDFNYVLKQLRQVFIL